ncbi:MAG: YciI family protein [Bryobacteraceae bacterium]
MTYFFCRLNAPRRTFSQDMTPEEFAVMQAHVAYWSELTAKRIAIAFGPVADPKGAWGLGVVEVENEDEVRGVVDNDPAMKGGAGFSFDVYPMPRVISRS